MALMNPAMNTAMNTEYTAMTLAVMLDSTCSATGTHLSMQILAMNLVATVITVARIAFRGKESLVRV